MFKLEKVNDKAVLTIYGYVGGYMDFRSVGDALDYISNNGIKSVDFHIHTLGGSVFDGNLIYNFIRSFKGKIEIYIDGIAASMGAIIALASDRVHIAENGFIMIHSPSGFTEGTAKDHIEGAKLLRSIEKNFVQKLSERTGRTPQDVASDWMDGSDHWIDADEAIALNLAVDKFAPVNGNVTFTKSDAEKEGLKTVFGRYSALLNETEIFTETNTDIIMKNINLKLKLKEDATEAEAVTAICDLESRVQNAEIELTRYREQEQNARRAEALTLIENAIREQRVDANAREAWTSSFEKNFEGAKAMLASIPRRVTAENIIGNSGDDPNLKKSWDELYRSGALGTFKQTNLEAFKAKYKEKFGREYAG